MHVPNKLLVDIKMVYLVFSTKVAKGVVLLRISYIL